MTHSDLPALNAVLNGLSTVLIVAGWIAVRRERKLTHVMCMCAAMVSTALFLIGVLVIRFRGGAESDFTSRAIALPMPYFLACTHTIGAFALIPLLIATVVPVLIADWQMHRRMGNLTLILWLCVSLTGVAAYFLNGKTALRQKAPRSSVAAAQAR